MKSVLFLILKSSDYRTFKELTRNVLLKPYKSKFLKIVAETEKYLNNTISNREMTVWNRYLIQGLKKIKRDIERL